MKVLSIFTDLGDNVVFNDNSNKVLDLTAMAIKMEEIRLP